MISGPTTKSLLLLSAAASTKAWLQPTTPVTSSTRLHSDPNSFADKIEQGDYSGLPDSLVKAIKEKEEYEAIMRSRQPSAPAPAPAPAAPASEASGENPFSSFMASFEKDEKESSEEGSGLFSFLGGSSKDEALEAPSFSFMDETRPQEDAPSWSKTVPGVAEPLGFWDPLGLSSMIGEERQGLKFLQEAEFVHGRVAMLATVGLLTSELVHDGPALHYTDDLPTSSWAALLFVSVFVEYVRAEVGFSPYKAPWNPSPWTVIRPKYEPGNLGIDPLELKPQDNAAEFMEYRTKELQNGRLAMIAITGILFQEAVTNQPIF